MAVTAKTGAQITARDAYVDLVVLNAWSGPGPTEIWLDDLHVEGSVAASHVVDMRRTAARQQVDPQVRPVGFVETGAPPFPFRKDGTVIERNGRPFSPRIIQYNGEPLQQLKDLGFNTVECAVTPTPGFLVQARQLDLWVICPPPESVGVDPLGAEYDGVLAWSLGSKLDADDLLRTRQLLRELDASEPDAARFRLVSATDNWSEYATLADVVSVGQEPIGGSFVLDSYGKWIQERVQLTGRNVPLIADVQTEIPEVLLEQSSALAQRVPPMPIQPQQMRYMVYEAMGGGARGLRFLSRSRLDGTDPMSELRRTTLQWINAQIDLIEPWMAGGGVIQDPGLESLDDRRTKITLINTDRSRLLLIQRATSMEQWVAGSAPVEPVRFSSSGTAPADRAYLLADYGLRPLPWGAELGRTEITVNHCPSLAAILLTQDASVVSQVSERYANRQAESRSCILN